MAAYNAYGSFSNQNYIPSTSSNQNYIPSTSSNQNYTTPSAPPMQYSSSSNPNSGSYSSSYSGSYSSYPSAYPQQGGYNSGFQDYTAFFPPGTDPEVIRSFQAVDRDRSGSIEERELQSALSSVYQGFGIRTVRLLLFLFKNPRGPSDRIGNESMNALF
jgi:calcium-binding protein CML